MIKEINCIGCGVIMIIVYYPWQERLNKVRKYCSKKCMFNSDIYRNKHISNSMRMWENLEFQDKLRIIHHSEEYVSKQSNATKKRFENLEERQKQSERTRISSSQPERIQKFVRDIKKWHQTASPETKRMTRIKRSNSVKKMWTGQGGVNIINSIRQPEVKKKMSNSQKKRFENSIERQKMAESKKISNIIRREKLGINRPTIGTSEKQILDNLEKCFGEKIVRQHRVGRYFIDGYIPRYNLAIEVDESRHYDRLTGELEQRDKQRQHEIEKELQCPLFRIPITNELKSRCLSL